MNTVKRDLDKHINHRLRLWINDSFQSYAIADLRKQGYAAIVTCLFRSLTTAMCVAGLTDDEAHTIFDNHWQAAKRAKAKVRAANEEDLDKWASDWDE